MKTIIIFLYSVFLFSSVQAQSIFDAARSGNIDAVLQMKNVNFDTADARGFTPLILAVYNNQLEMTKFLLKNGANPNIQDASGNTALLGTCFKGLPELAKVLIENNADINLANYNNATPLIFAATFGQLQIAELLLSKKADKAIQDNRGKTALDHATLQENEEMMQLLK